MAAQAPEPEARATSADREGAVARADDGGRSWLRTLAGRSSGRRRVIFGLWAMHPFEPQFPELDWTRGFGAQAGSWFAATFVNSYDVRSFVGGLERNWAAGGDGAVRAGFGYRLGLVTGYDERLVSWADDTPVLPFVGVLGWVDLGALGLDVFYVYRAITLEASILF